MKVIAFDVDGALTEDEGMSEYTRVKNQENTVGIVSARSMTGINEFIVNNNIKPDFRRSSMLKVRELRSIMDEFEAEEYIYYGSWLRDRVAANLAGWQYRKI